ncbi:MAG: biotin transporter BioY [Clostridiales Family XIII bacterium]|jgi:biotin transport system substrate-specific component|nr:biotin transporter BioY [Clostridiales Family XIII bacterium]
MKKRNELYLYILCAFFAALTAVCSQIMVPLPFTPVPINLALLAVFVCGTVLGPKKGAISMLIYILLGLVGVPVFAGFTGGFGILAGPTGGYIVGYLASAVVMGLLASGKASTFKSKVMEKLPAESTKKSARTIASVGLTLVTGIPAIAACYALGTAWFMISTGTGFAASMLMCVIPFIPGDFVKIIFAAAVCEALRRPMRALDILASK